MTIVGVYHKGCIDGTTAVAVLQRKFPDAKMYSLTHNFAPSDLTTILEMLTKDTEVYTLDCALGVEEFLERGVMVTTLDHHISVQEKLTALAQRNPQFRYVFDNSKSGASLSWSYFFPDIHRPWVIDLVEDHDLGKWNLIPETRYINNYLLSFVDMPEAVSPLFEGISNQVEKEGIFITRYIDLLVEKFSELKPVILRIGDYVVHGYNVTTSQSEVGARLSKEGGGAVCLFTIQGDAVRLSFRSGPGQVPSALDLANVLDGGGHVQASGAKISLPMFLSLLKV